MSSTYEELKVLEEELIWLRDRLLGVAFTSRRLLARRPVLSATLERCVEMINSALNLMEGDLSLHSKFYFVESVSGVKLAGTRCKPE